jgi:hypothetical protein
MINKNKKMTFLLMTMAVLVFGLLTAGCNGNGPGPNLNKCVPCGDFAMTCKTNCTTSGCPVCYSIDAESGDFKMVFEDGSYYLMSSDGMTVYDKDDNVCYSMVNDGTETTFYDGNGNECYAVVADGGDITYEIEGESYTAHADESWTCPDGSTWETDPSCDEAGYDKLDNPSSSCPPFNPMTSPECD